MELYVIIIQYHEDLKYFRNTTINNIVIMGRKTYESLPNGYLNNRMNIVITNKYLDYKNKKIFIIGGSEIYKLFCDYCDTIHLTMINNNILGDIIFTEPKYKTIYKLYITPTE